MRVLITGGSGLIGRALAANLVRDGNEVIILSRRPGQITGLPEGVSARWWDGHTTEGWHSLVNGTDAVINLAGENISSGRWTKERKHHILESRLNAGRAVVRAVEAAARKPHIIVQASGVGYYGPCGDEEITEETQPGHDFLAQLAVDWEASTASLEGLGIRRVVIRTGVVLSTAGGALPRLLLPFRFFAGGHLGSGQQWFPWIHIADEVGAIRFLIENEKASGPFNLTSPTPLTNAGFSRLLGRCLRRPAFMPIPAFILRLLFGEMATAILDGQRAVPQRLSKLGFAFRFSGAGSALKDLLG
jgi:uncharacterized protein (TIGR01777 family)